MIYSLVTKQYSDCCQYRPYLVHVEHGLGCVAHHEDEDDGCEDGSHGGVTAVAVAVHEVGVVRVCTGHSTEDQAVQQGEKKHRAKPHH